MWRFLRALDAIVPDLVLLWISFVNLLFVSSFVLLIMYFFGFLWNLYVQL